MSLLSFWAATAAVLAQAPAPVPTNHIPGPVVMEVRALEQQFDLALSRDCAPERCFSKGCVYREHVVVDLPRSGSLPGLGQDQGVGSVPPQEYLTQARCEFTHEKAIPAKDVQALTRRLEQRLSKGWLQVIVAPKPLDPISPSLRESPTPPPEVAPEAPKPAEAKPAEPQKWDAELAIRELWTTLLPHFAWMIAVFLVTLAAMTVIWALRRLGRESLEEKVMAAQLAAEAQRPAQPVVDEAALAEAEKRAAEEAAKVEDQQEQDRAFVAAQSAVWTDKISGAELTREDNGVVELLRNWLRTGEFALLAKAIFTFGDRLSIALSSEGELASRKVQFAEFLKTVDPSTLPSDADFFKKLNQHSLSSSVLSQPDAEIYRSLHEEFGAAGVARLVESFPGRAGALLFGLVPSDTQQDVARILRNETRQHVASQLMLSNRISKEELAHLFDVLKAARAGKPLPKAPPAEGIMDRGLEFDAAGALSVIMQHIQSEERAGLFGRMLQQSAGALPRWYEDILYPDMLMKLPKELQADLLLDVDVKGLAGWSSIQPLAWQETFLSKLAPAMQNAVRASMMFNSREDQLRQAKLGHSQLVTAVKKQVAQGKLSFSEIVS